MSGDLATSLREVWDAKKNLRHTLKVPRDIPFNKYIVYYPWLGEDIPEDGLAYDFTGNRYSQEGVPVLMGDISEFIRLSSATKWQDGQLVEVQNNIPRISGEGLLIEEQRTNLASISLTTPASWSQDNVTTSVGDTLAPDGSMMALSLAADTVGETPQTYRIFYPFGISESRPDTHTVSFYAKARETDKVRLLCGASPNTWFVFDLGSATVPVMGGHGASITPVGGGWFHCSATVKIEGGWSSSVFTCYLYAASPASGGTTWVAQHGDGLYFWGVQIEEGATASSYIPTIDSPVTRAPDNLNIQRLPTQTITGDWDADVTYTVSGSVATFAGHGYIQNIDVVHNPISPFKGGEKGFWIEPYDSSTLFQDSDGTIPVVEGDPIGLVLDRSGNNYHLSQTVSASRPELLDGGIVFDRVDDALSLTVPDGGITGTLFLATTRGTTSYGVSMPAGEWSLGNAFNPLGDVVSAVLVDRTLSEVEKARLHVFGISKGGTEFGAETVIGAAFREWGHLTEFPLIDTSRCRTFTQAWYGCSELTSFPELDVSSGTVFASAWNRCSGLTSFPELDVSSGVAFPSAWTGCYSLVSFPANFFDNCIATNFSNAFLNTNLSQASIDGILVSINSNATSNGTFNQSGGSAPSIVGQTAIDAMRERGWTVTTTGGY